MEKLTDASFYNLSIPVKVNAGTDKEREEFKIVGYGMPFDSCIKQIVDYRMANWKDHILQKSILIYMKIWL